MNKKSLPKFIKKSANALLIIMILCVGSFNIICYPYLNMSGNMTLTTDSIELPESLLKAEINAAIPASALQQLNGNELLDLQIFDGELTVKSIKVQRNKQIYVVPGGQAIGILLHTDGVTVVGLSPVINTEGKPCYPAQDAGIQTGDFITSVNGVPIIYDLQVAEQVKYCGENNIEVAIDFQRGKEKHSIKVKPQYCTDSHSWRIGLYVRDNTAGVGTMTFWEPNSGKYAALGHEISDPEDKASKGEDKGSIIKASIQGVKIGEAGAPGEKLGVFVNDTWRGSIEKNCLFGIYGVLEREADNAISQAIPVACCDEVKVGAAQIYTVLDGENVECFDIEIIKLLPNYKLSGKGMVIQVTDTELIERTGGIIQGMSGSPIIQNGRLIGAVTHVFINDPQRGYGCMAEWMMEEAGLWD